MRYVTSKLYLTFLGCLIASNGALPRTAEEPVTAYVDVNREAVIAFLPPSMQNLQESGVVEAQNRVRWAVDSVERCLRDDHVYYEVVFAERIVVRSLAGEETFELGRLWPLVGALLLRPDSNARILFAGGGPEALERLIRQAAGEYFGKECDAD
jgi:hypothetical protein